MKTTKFLAALLAGTMLCGTLAGCGGSSSSGSAGSSSDGASSSASSGSGENITLIMALRDQFLSELESAAKDAAAEVGVNLTTQDANNDTSKLIQYIETARNAGDKAIIINMVDPATAAQCIEAAGDMKVVFVNRYPTDPSVLSDSAVYVGSDEMESGGYQAEFLCDYFKAQGKTEISYILLNGTLGQTSTENRTASVLAGLEAGGITATEAAAPLAADYDRATAMDMISPLVDTVQYDCIISNNDEMALGAIEALKSKDLDPTAIPIVGVDASTAGRESIKNGELMMSVYQNPYGQGSGALHAAVNLVNGDPINKDTDFEIDDEDPYVLWVPFEPVTIDNVDDYN
jgi:ABC-type sugar transport system substrate-binding protein